MEVGCSKREVCLARRIDSGKHQRSRERSAAGLDNPEVQPRIEVRSGNLARRAENGLALLRVRQCVPRKDLCIGETLPALRELLEYVLDGRLCRRLETATIATVADELASADFSRGHSLRRA